jgi:hypothetical protein
MGAVMTAGRVAWDTPVSALVRSNTDTRGRLILSLLTALPLVTKRLPEPHEPSYLQTTLSVWCSLKMVCVIKTAGSMEEAGDAEADPPLPAAENQEKKRTPSTSTNKVDLKILIRGLKKIEALNHALAQSPAQVNATTTPITPSPRPDNIFEVIFQEIKMPSENYSTFREWFSTKAEEKESLSLEEARNIVLFVHLHLSDNPEVTRQYSIRLLKKNCPLSPPSFYQLARWSHEIRDREKQKKDLDTVNCSESAAKWEAVKDCMQHGLFQNKIVPMSGTSADCCPSCAKTRMDLQTTEGVNRPIVAGEMVRSKSSKDTRADPAPRAAMGTIGGGLERSASGHTLREQKVCPNCGKTFVPVAVATAAAASVPDGEVIRQVSQKVGDEAVAVSPAALKTSDSGGQPRREPSAERDKRASNETSSEREAA